MKYYRRVLLGASALLLVASQSQALTINYDEVFTIDPGATTFKDLDGTTNRTADWLGSPTINNNGQMAFLMRDTSSRDYILRDLDDGNGFRTIASEAQSAAASFDFANPSGNLTSVSSPAIFDNGFVNVLAFRSGGAGLKTIPTTGSVTTVTERGKFNSALNGNVNGQGRGRTATNGSMALYLSDDNNVDYLIHYDSSGTFRKVLQNGDAAPDALGNPTSFLFDETGGMDPATNASGVTAANTEVDDGTTVSEGLWVWDAAGNGRRSAFVGEDAKVAGRTFTGFNAPAAVSADGDVAYMAQFTNINGIDRGFYIDRGNGPELLFQEGDDLGVMIGDSRFNGVTVTPGTTYTYAPDGRLAIHLSLTGTTSDNVDVSDFAIIVSDGSGDPGSFGLVAYKGQQIFSKTIEKVNASNFDSNAFNDDGQLVYWVNFTNDDDSIVLADIGSQLLPNAQPVAALIDPTDFVAGQLLRSFDGSASSDADTTDVLTYDWSRVLDANGDGTFDEASVPLTGSAALEGFSLQQLGFTKTTDKVEVTLSVSDGRDSDTATVEVGYTNATPGIDGLLSVTWDANGLQLAGTLTDADLDVPIAGFEQLTWVLRGAGEVLLTGTFDTLGGAVLDEVLSYRETLDAVGGFGPLELTFELYDRALGVANQLVFDSSDQAALSIELAEVPAPAAGALLLPALGWAATRRRPRAVTG